MRCENREKVKPVEYGISTDALAKWAGENLGWETERGDERHYRFSHRGSTCMDGGTPFTAVVHVVLQEGSCEWVVKSARIDFSQGEMPCEKEMCAYLTDGERFFEALVEPPAFCGRALESILADPIEVNYAGCLCESPMVNHKWIAALSTIHYALIQEAAGK